MTSAPLVSVIIPCYNAGRFVRDALDSALAQTYAAVEIVLVNDGSTEDLEPTLAPYRNHARVKIIAQTNQGLPAARNRGIRESRGEYLKFLDADDWLAPNALAKQVAAFETQPAPGLVYCDLQRVNAQGEPLDDYAVATARRILNGDILPSLLVGGYFTPHTVLVPRRVLDQVGLYDETLGGTADTELWMRIVCENFSARFIPEKLAYYRIHDTNMSADTAHMLETQQRALDAIVTRYPHRVASALHELICEHQRVDRDSAWAREMIAAQQREIDALRRALNKRGVRLARAAERWWQHE